jgi:hypothetical protein
MGIPPTLYSFVRILCSSTRDDSQGAEKRNKRTNNDRDNFDEAERHLRATTK